MISSLQIAFFQLHHFHYRGQKGFCKVAERKENRKKIEILKCMAKEIRISSEKVRIGITNFG